MPDVVFALDVEDPIHPEADDALLRLARLFADEDVPLSLFIAGEKARLLRQRGRRDVLDALQPHEICYHGNYWGDFPEPAMIYGAEKPWDDAVRFALGVETPGLNDVAQITGRFPVAWCCHQAQQCPPLAYALKLAGVRCWAGGPRGYLMDWLSFPRSGCAVSMQGAWGRPADPLHPEEAKPACDPDADFAAFQRAFDACAEKNDFLTVLGHPTCWAFAEWWGWYEWPLLFPADAAPGPYPRGRRFRRAQARTPADQEAALETTRRIVRWVKSRSDARIVTYAQLADEEAEPRPLWLDWDQSLALMRRVRERFTYVTDFGSSFSPADIFYLAAHAVQHAQETGRWPAAQQVRRTLGPGDTVVQHPGGVEVPRADLIVSAMQAHNYILDHDRLPHGVRCRQIDLGPAELLRAMVDFIHRAVETGRSPETVRLEAGPHLPEAAQEPAITMRRFGSSCLPVGFDPGRLWELLKLQSWSYRPATRSAERSS